MGTPEVAMLGPAQSLLTLVAVGVWTALCSAVLTPLLRRCGMMRTNYRGASVVTATGMIIVIGAVPGVLFVASPAGRDWRFCHALALALACFGALGFADDRWGSPAAKGLRGHLRKLVIERRITSGLVKAAGGLVAAAVIASEFLHLAPLRAALATLIIGLAANAINLLDMRPGRASATSIALLTVAAAGLALADHRQDASAAACVAVATAVLYTPDARGWAMLGDTGSNALGACVGLSLLQAFPGLPSWLALLACLTIVHIVAERWSLSRSIEGSRLLAAVDRLTGVR
jgi:UDP-N-acetylmuramyl pentapeptide phosphotransferase/UDP-N-acetylglucosamine-1-phosphate transferase